MRTCDGCGERATASCPYCEADGCDACAPVCDHDARHLTKVSDLDEWRKAGVDIAAAIPNGRDSK
jgi:hypothetical protein